MLIMVADGAPGYSFIACRGMSEAYHYYQSNGTLQMALTWSDRTVTWQNGGGLEYNMNAEGHTYHIVALLQAGE